MSNESRQLDYAAPENSPPNVDGLLQAARWLCWIGLVVPLAGLGAAAWAGVAMAQPFIVHADKERAQRLLVAGIIAFVINAAVLVSFVLSFSHKVSARGF